MNHIRKFIFFFLFMAIQNLLSQTTGKIAGTVFDAATNEPLAGANVLVQNTSMGASVDAEGFFFIINIPPGNYTLSIEMLGYKNYKIENVRVSVNRTANVEARLEPTIIEGETIVVQAEKITEKKDQTSSVRTVSSEQMEVLPVESVGAIIAMQAGVVNGSFRGGRRNEVSYMIDGLPVTETFGGEGRTVDLEPGSIAELEVNTGNFNAEYGRAMSGIVNQVVKSGGMEYKGSFNISSGTYLTSHTGSGYTTDDDLVFIGLDKIDLLRNKDVSASFSGPLWPSAEKFTFFLNARYQDRKNHLNGIRRFNVDDFSRKDSDSGFWYSESTGDGKYVPMNESLNFSLLGKLTYNINGNAKASLLYTRNDDEWNGYNHAFKYNPDGVPTSFRETDMYLLQFSHMVSKNFFYEGNFSYVDNFNGYYLFSDPTSSKYIHDGYLYGTQQEAVGFNTGGQDKANNHRYLIEKNAKMDMTWQIDNNHNLKGGFLYTQHELTNTEGSVRNKFFDDGDPTADDIIFNGNGEIEFINYQPYFPSNQSIYADKYKANPKEVSAYIQDKMEHDDMVINFGLRLDYFNPNTTFPTDLRNPNNSLFGNDSTRQSEYIAADEQIQLSPRLGLAYKLGERAVLRFSYGHFFQVPPMYALFQRNTYFISTNDYETVLGNPNLNAQRTVQYEMGLWQQITREFSLDVALYYRDIYELLSTKSISTYNQVEYGLYTNKDYGNTKGLEVKLDYNSGGINAFINYTLQYTRGNSDNPTQNFDREGNNTDPVKKLFLMSWDQRHTLNASVGYTEDNWGTIVTAYYNSGAPYTYSPSQISSLIEITLPPNNDPMPQRFSIDLNSFYRIQLDYGILVQWNLEIYNLLDMLNEQSVYNRTGRAYINVDDTGTLEESHQEDFNDWEDQFRNPSMYSAPRYVKLGMDIFY